MRLNKLKKWRHQMNQVVKEKIKIGVWGAIGGAVVTMIIGFAWGGWVLGSNSLNMSKETARTAVVDRLAPICVAQFNQDPDRDKKLVEFKEVSSWKKGQYVQDQGWATMPFEKEPDGSVADRCSALIMEKSL
jgi:hypothetical protein